MTRTRLRSHIFKNRSDRNRELFCKQGALSVSILRKSKKYYSKSLIRNKLQILRDNFGKRLSTFCQKRFNLQIQLI